MHRTATTAALALLALACLWGCENDTSNSIDPNSVLTEMTCYGCHSSQEMLVASLGEEAAAKVSVWNKDDG